MLMATKSESTDSLELFRLTLEILSRDRKDIPPRLETYANDVIKQAHEVLANPHASTSTFLAESLSLALQMMLSNSLKAELTSHHEVSMISSSLARKLLIGLRQA